jgi:hypothetical protein
LGNLHKEVSLVKHELFQHAGVGGEFILSTPQKTGDIKPIL